MSGKKNHSDKFAGSDAHQSTKKKRGKHTVIADFIEQLHSVDTLYMIAGICQVMLGLAVVLISALGLIRPFWVSMLLTTLACITTMTGVYLCYSSFFKSEKGSLIRNAMRRIVEDQN